MHSYDHVATLVYGIPLAITPDKADEWGRVMQERMAGGGQRFTQAEAEAAHEARMVGFADATGARPTREGYVVTDAGVAVIPIHGSLVHRGGFMEAMSGVTGYNTIRGQLRAAARNPDVRGIVLDVDSPGGHVAGVFELADMIRGVGKPTRAIANETAASSAMLLASAADKLYAKPTSMLGSIAALMLHVDRSKQHDKQGVRHTAITSGARKTEFSSMAPLTPEARKVAQEQVDEVGDMLVAAVADYRGADEDDVRGTQGAVLTYRQAEALGLVDGQSTLSALIETFTAELDADEAGAAARDKVRPRAAVSAESPTTGVEDMANKPAEQEAAAQATTAAASGITVEAAAKQASDAAAAARNAERARVKAILESPEAKGREGLAAHLAHDTDMAAEAAVTLMSKSPKDAAVTAAAPANPLATAMERTGNPDVTAGTNGAESNEETVESVAAGIVAHFPKQPRAA